MANDRLAEAYMVDGSSVRVEAGGHASRAVDMVAAGKMNDG